MDGSEEEVFEVLCDQLRFVGLDPYDWITARLGHRKPLNDNPVQSQGGHETGIPTPCTDPVRAIMRATVATMNPKLSLIAGPAAFDALESVWAAKGLHLNPEDPEVLGLKLQRSYVIRSSDLLAVARPFRIRVEES